MIKNYLRTKIVKICQIVVIRIHYAAFTTNLTRDQILCLVASAWFMSLSFKECKLPSFSFCSSLMVANIDSSDKLINCCSLTPTSISRMFGVFKFLSLSKYKENLFFFLKAIFKFEMTKMTNFKLNFLWYI